MHVYKIDFTIFLYGYTNFNSVPLLSSDCNCKSAWIMSALLFIFNKPDPLSAVSKSNPLPSSWILIIKLSGKYSKLIFKCFAEAYFTVLDINSCRIRNKIILSLLFLNCDLSPAIINSACINCSLFNRSTSFCAVS